MRVVPLTLARAGDFVTAFHRHNKRPQGHRFSIGLLAHCPLFDEERLVGVAVVGRPVARKLDDGETAEVTRLCVEPDVPLGACSKLYRHAWRAWREMGGRKIVTYTLQSESGASLRGAGFVREKELPGNKGQAWQTRDGREKQDVVGEPKIRWSIEATT